MGGASLSIGAGDMYGGKMVLRLAQKSAKLSDIGEIFPDSRISYSLKHRQAAKEEINRLSIVHDIQVDTSKMGKLFYLPSKKY